MQTLLEIHDWINTPPMKEMGIAIDKNTVHSYIEIYDKLLSPYRQKSGQVLDLRTNKGRWDDVMLIYRKDDR